MVAQNQGIGGEASQPSTEGGDGEAGQPSVMVVKRLKRLKSPESSSLQQGFSQCRRPTPGAATVIYIPTCIGRGSFKNILCLTHA